MTGNWRVGGFLLGNAGINGSVELELSIDEKIKIVVGLKLGGDFMENCNRFVTATTTKRRERK